MEKHAEILIASRDARQTRVLREALGRLGATYHVGEAQTMGEVREHARAADIDLLVMDARLLQTDRAGVEQLFAHCPQAAIIWLTTNGCHVLKPVLVAGPQPYRCFDKPVEIDRIRQAAVTLIQRNSNHTNPTPL